jgi:hypothetical protein
VRQGLSLCPQCNDHPESDARSAAKAGKSLWLMAFSAAKVQRLLPSCSIGVAFLGIVFRGLANRFSQCNKSAKWLVMSVKVDPAYRQCDWNGKCIAET